MFYDIGTWNGYNQNIWNHIEYIDVNNDDEANKYAEAHYPNIEWYILDKNGNNING
jgi:hypothetical protein